jgi:sulfur-carrier protein
MTIFVDAAAPVSGIAQSAARVLFFGRIAVPIPSGGCSLADLKGRVALQVNGGVAALGDPCVRVAIDQVMVGDDPWVSPGQEVAFLSAFSGG